jgi:hypothetical protein
MYIHKSEVGGVSPTGKLFRFVRACDAKLCAGESASGSGEGVVPPGAGLFSSLACCAPPPPCPPPPCPPLWRVRLWSRRVLSRGSGAFSRAPGVFWRGSGAFWCVPVIFSALVRVNSGLDPRRRWSRGCLIRAFVCVCGCV